MASDFLFFVNLFLIMILVSFKISAHFTVVLIYEKWKYSSLSPIGLFSSMHCGPPGSFIHGLLQARIQEWVAISFSWGSFWPRDQTHVSCIAGRFLTIWATREVHVLVYSNLYVWFAPLFTSWSLELFLIYVQSLLLASTFMPHFSSSKSEFLRQLPEN